MIIRVHHSAVLYNLSGVACPELSSQITTLNHVGEPASAMGVATVPLRLSLSAIVLPDRRVP